MLSSYCDSNEIGQSNWLLKQVQCHIDLYSLPLKKTLGCAVLSNVLETEFIMLTEIVEHYTNTAQNIKYYYHLTASFQGPLLLNGLTKSSMKSDYIHHKVWDELTY